ncbi:MAG: TauD/TfdA family dioxygenase [bacterium]|jgi:hypothetical protein|nr:TauD/TfdA family dioxygenase [Betaproteobacteria bacterium]
MTLAASSVVLTAPVRDASAWTGEQLRRGPEDWVWNLSPATLAEVDRALASVRSAGRPLESVSREDFALPSLTAEFSRIAAELEEGRGFVQIRGLDPARYDADDLAVIFWGVSAHLGTALSQNARGDLLGYVRDEGRDMSDGRTRLYQTSLRQRFHTDIGADVVGLCCVRPATEGGLSLVASSAAVYNAMLERYPYLLGVLYDRFNLDWRGEQPPGEPGWYSEPVYAWHEGKLSCRFSATLIESAQRVSGEVLTPVQREALRRVEELAEELCIQVAFRPGDMQFISNYRVLHDRTAFSDDGDREHGRLLYRVWLTLPGARSLPPEWGGRARSGIARQQG